MPPHAQNHYSTLYSQSLPTERRFNPWPFAIGFAVLSLLGLVLWWVFTGMGTLGLFGPSQSPTDSNKIVSLDLAGQHFWIPENYLRSREQRAGGTVDQIDLHVMWPSMKGFNDADAEAFRDKSADAKVIYITLNAPNQVWRPAERFYQVYPYYFTGPEERAEFDLMTRKMDTGSGIADHDVLYHQSTDRFTLFHCLRDKPDLLPADCVGDKVIEPKVLARYRFRRKMLRDWQQIDLAVEDLLAQFSRQ